jgi:stalled ribosome rescue protein Dom34
MSDQELIEFAKILEAEMTDEELIAHLRNSKGWPTLGNAAADRIEQLDKACYEWAETSQSNYQRAKVSEAKLNKAVEALLVALEVMKCVDGENDCSRGIDAAQSVLAEIGVHSYANDILKEHL